MWLKKITLRHAEHEGTQRKPFVKLRGLSALVVKKINTETRRTPRNIEFNFLILHFTLEILHWKFLIEFLCSLCLRGKFEFCYLIFVISLCVLRISAVRLSFGIWFFVIFFCVLRASVVKLSFGIWIIEIFLCVLYVYVVEKNNTENTGHTKRHRE